MEYADQAVSVSGFNDEHEVLKDIPIATAATAYDDQDDGMTYILILGQAIYLGDKMNTSILCPN